LSYPTQLDIARGLARGLTAGRQFGRNSAVGATFVPIANGGIYRTPQPAGATRLRIAAGNAADSPAGAGARSIRIRGLNASGEAVEETLSTNGASAGPVSTHSYLRLYAAYVETSGTYATQTAGSHVGTITIQNEAGTETWATITDGAQPRGEAQIGVISVPARRQLYITDLTIAADAEKKISIKLYQRRNILQAAAPYSALRVVEEYASIGGLFELHYAAPLGPFPPLTDIGFMAAISASTADVSAAFDYFLETIP